MPMVPELSIRSLAGSLLPTEATVVTVTLSSDTIIVILLSVTGAVVEAFPANELIPSVVSKDTFLELISLVVDDVMGTLLKKPRFNKE